MIYDLIVLGGGAAGIFAALSAKEANPSAQVLVLEKTAVLLSKVKISGGGRCNVTHACLDPLTLCRNYPRGEKELLGPFHRFGPSQTIQWFESRGTFLKTEVDGRMFPITDDSQTIIQTLLSDASTKGVEIRLRQKISGVYRNEEDCLFQVLLEEQTSLVAKALLLATGNSSQGHLFATSLGHSIESPVPSLFTFNTPTSPLKELSGISVEEASVSLAGAPFSYTGPLLITHFGFSGPAVLKLSAWAARYLAEKEYRCPVHINWLPSLTKESILDQLMDLKKTSSKSTLTADSYFHLPKKLWRSLLSSALEDPTKKIGELSSKELRALSEKLHKDEYLIEGKTTHKEEFVTCGGVCLSEINFKTFESKCCKGLFFAGEILNIDGITGGFNFQNAWTSGWIAGRSAVAK